MSSECKYSVGADMYQCTLRSHIVYSIVATIGANAAHHRLGEWMLSAKEADELKMLLMDC